MSTEDVTAHDDGGGLVRVWLKLLGALALCSTVGARAFSEALPGAVAGIEAWIDRTRFIAAFLSQLMVVFGGLTAIVALLVTTLRPQHLSHAFRLLAFPATAVVLTLVVLSIFVPLDPSEGLIIGVASVLLATTAALSVMRHPEVRAAGLLLLAAAMGGGIHLVAHELGGSDHAALVALSRPMATIAYIADLLSLTLATAWLSSRGSRALRVVLIVFGLGAILVAWGAMVGSHDGASLWQVLASRGLSTMTSWPAPLVSDMARHWADAYALLAALLLVAVRTPKPAIATSMALALLARGDPDIPLIALMLVLA